MQLHARADHRRPAAHALLALALPALAACSGQSGAAAAAPSSAARLHFVDVAAEVGIDVEIVSGDPRRWYIVESNGSGAAWLDYDSDGDPDLFVANGQGLEYLDDGRRLERDPRASTRLYRNDGPRDDAGDDASGGARWRFTDVTDESGARRSDWINGVATGDVDNDGDPDLYLACFGADVLLVNEGGRFVDGTARAGLGCELWGATATLGDVDNDGALDLFVANYVQFDLEQPPADGARDVFEGVQIGWGPEAENPHGYNPGAPNRFYKGDGTGVFVEATESSGLALERALCSYAAVFTDVDADGWQDLLVANDKQPCNLFHNRGDGSFDEQGVARGFAFNGDGQPTAAMGFALADVDGNGAIDCLRTNFDFEQNTLHLNDGAGKFSDRGARYGLGAPSFDRLGWAATFFDAECDGDLDLLVANGHVMPQAAEIGMSGWAMQSQLYAAEPRADGSLAYSDATASAGPGLAPLRSSRAIALADYDADGDLDAFISDLDERPRLLENRSARAGRWIGVQLEGSSSNRDAYGARVTVSAISGLDAPPGQRRWTQEMRTTNGLYGAHDPRLHFGLGAVERVASIEVHWPSGQSTLVTDPQLDRLHLVREPRPSSR